MVALKNIRIQVLVGMALVALGAAAHANVERDVASSFPQVRETTNPGEILNSYPAYLEFVLAIGRDVDPNTAHALRSKYNHLLKADRKAAAKFLSGLRFEIVQKVEFTNADPARLSTNNQMLRTLVKKYIKQWYREADEHLFRAQTSRALVRKDS